MLVKPSIDELLPKTQNRYTLAILVAKRTRQLVDGAEPLVESDTPNMVSLASEEVAAGTVTAVPGDVKPEIPLRPEVLAELEAARQQAENDLSLENLRQDFMEAAGSIAAAAAEEPEEAPKSVLKPLPEGTSFSPELYGDDEDVPETVQEIDGQRYSTVRRKARPAGDAEEAETAADEAVADDTDEDVDDEVIAAAADDEEEVEGLDLTDLLDDDSDDLDEDEDEDDEDILGSIDTSSLDDDKENY